MENTVIIICGLGAVGSNIALNIVHDIKNIHIVGIDYDKVELRNVAAGTQLYTKGDINKFKTQALQHILFKECKKTIEIVNAEIKSHIHMNSIVQYYRDRKYRIVLIDAFDNAEARKYTYGICENTLHVGFSPAMTGEAVWDNVWTPVTDYSGETDDICTQIGARSFIITLTGLASIIINRFFYQNEKINIFFDNKSLKTKVF